MHVAFICICGYPFIRASCFQCLESGYFAYQYMLLTLYYFITGKMDEDFVLEESQALRAEIAFLHKELAAAKALNAQSVAAKGIIIVIININNNYLIEPNILLIIIIL